MSPAFYFLLTFLFVIPCVCRAMTVQSALETEGVRLTQMVQELKETLRSTRDYFSDSLILLIHLDCNLRKDREAKILSKFKQSFRQEHKTARQDTETRERDNLSSSLISDDVEGLLKKHSVSSIYFLVCFFGNILIFMTLCIIGGFLQCFTF